MWGKHLSEEYKQKIGKTNSGENHPMWGKKHTEETKKMMRENHADFSGENSYRWQGGISFNKYCSLFNNSFKRKMRNQYHNKCFICGKTKEENNKELDVHHVNYNKDCLCGTICEFVPLCRSCHMKTNYNRKYWEDLIMYYLYPEKYFIIDF